MSWCPSCGAEYRAGFTECADCRVALVAEPPPPGEPVTNPDDHAEVAYSLDDWEPDRCRALEMMLTGARIPYVWDDGALHVGNSHAEEVEEMIDALEEGEIVEDDVDAITDTAMPADEPDGG